MARERGDRLARRHYQVPDWDSCYIGDDGSHWPSHPHSTRSPLPSKVDISMRWYQLLAGILGILIVAAGIYYALQEGL